MKRSTLLYVILWFFSYLNNGYAIVFYQISSLSDINLPAWSIGDAAVSAYKDICVYSTIVGNYGITISSTGGFVLSNGAYQIPYTLSWDDGGAGGLGASSTPLSNNVTLASRTHMNILTTNCSVGVLTPGPTARLTLTISQAAMIAARAGTYTGTITLVLSAM